MSIWEGIGKAAAEAAEALKTPAVPEAAARGTAEHPTVIKPGTIQPRTRAFMPDVPVAGVPEVAKEVNVTQNRTQTLPDKIQGLKTMLGGFIRRNPNLPKDVQEKMYTGSWRKNAADEVADLDVADWLKPLQTNPVEQHKLVSNYMTTADEVAQALRMGKTHVRDIPVETWQQSLSMLQAAVDKDPEVQQTLKNIRGGLDEQFDDMAARQWIPQDRYLEDYTPIRRINAMADGLASITGEEPEALKSRLIAAQRERSGGLDPREGDLVSTLRSTRAEYLRKVAEHELALDLFSDPTINLTEHYRNGEPLPKNVRVVRTGPGMFGATIKSNEGYFLDGALKSMDPKGQLNLGGFVVPNAIADAIAHFNTPVHTGAENKWYKAGTNIAKMLTVYNLANTNVNRPSDLAVAMFLPGEGPAHPMGVLRWYGEATKAAYKGSFNKGGTIVNLHGRPVDVWDLAIREGLTSGTIAHDVGGGLHVPPEIARLYPEAEQNHANWLQQIGRTLESDRLATEASPRIAAGLEAVERTGDWSQFGKVGRDVTFRYGAGSPQMATFPAIRMISPFITFQGLATARILDMANAKSLGTRGRLALGVMAVPLSFWMWNTQSDEYKQVENALPEYERNQLHIIVPDPINPAKVRRDVEGQPVVLRFRYWVPEQVMSQVGMGNLAERIGREAQGRDTPMQFLEQSGQQAGQSIGNMMVLPQIVKEMATGKSEAGQALSPVDLLNRAAPITRVVTNSVERAQNYGLAEGVKTAAGEAAGLRFAKPRHVDAQLLDAQLQDAVREMRQAKGAFATAAKNKSGSDFTDAKNDFLKKVKEVQRLQKQVKAEKEAGYAPPKADRSLTEVRRAGIQRANKEEK